MTRLAWLLMVGCSSRPVPPASARTPPADAAPVAETGDAPAPACVAPNGELLARGKLPVLCGLRWSACVDDACCATIDADGALAPVERPPPPGRDLRGVKLGKYLAAEVARVGAAQVTGDRRAVVVDHRAWSVAKDAPIALVVPPGAKHASPSVTAIGDVLVADWGGVARIATSSGTDVGSVIAGDAIMVVEAGTSAFALAAYPFDAGTAPSVTLYDAHTGAARGRLAIALRDPPLGATPLDGDAFAMTMQALHGVSVVVVSAADPDQPVVASENFVPACE